MCKKIMFVLVFSFLAGFLSASVPQAIVVDTKILLLAHPLMSVFDANTARFKGTSSEPIFGEYAGVEQVIVQVQEMETQLLKSSQLLREKLRQVPLTERIVAERAFLAEKKALEAKLEALKMRVYMARLVPIKQGMTPYASITPQVLDMTEAIKKVVTTLKAKYNAELVIDIADLLPYTQKHPLTTELMSNKHKILTDTKGPIPNNFSSWCSEAKEYWASREGVAADIVPYGALDVRLEALKLMEDEVKGYKIWDW